MDFLVLQAEIRRIRAELEYLERISGCSGLGINGINGISGRAPIATSLTQVAPLTPVSPRVPRDNIQQMIDPKLEENNQTQEEPHQITRHPASAYALWQEWHEGLNGGPSVVELDKRFKRINWTKTAAERKFVERRGYIVREIGAALDRGYDLEAACAEADKFRVYVCAGSWHKFAMHCACSWRAGEPVLFKE